MRSHRTPPFGALLLVAGFGPILIGTGWTAAAGRWLRDHPAATSSGVLSAAIVSAGLIVVGAFWIGRSRSSSGGDTDPLTGLALRHELWAAADDAIRENPTRPAGLLVIDLDGMGDVNEMVGFDRGDRVLVALAERLRGEVDATDVVARLGGDQFGVLRPACNDANELVAIGRQLAAALGEPVVVDGIELRIGAVVGAALAESGDLDATSLRSRSEAALYQASRHGVGTVELHRPGNDGELSPAQLTTWLSAAVHDDQLLLHHQPIVDLQSSAVVATEALLRWIHPEMGTISPASMLRGLEQSGQIVEVGGWVIGDACRQVRCWMDELGEASDPRVFVNISVRQLLEPGFVQVVESALRRNRISGDRLCFELGHLGELDGRSAVWSTLREARTLGVRLAIDNFGFAAASFAMLYRLPIDYLKLDRHLVASRTSNPHQDAVTAAVVAMGIELGCTVVAEGLEDASSTERARRFGCHLGQGYHLGMPVPGDELTSRVTVKPPVVVSAR